MHVFHADHDSLPTTSTPSGRRPIFPITSPSVDATGVFERVERIQARSLKGDAKRRALELALSMIDLTTLEGSDTAARVQQLCRKAVLPDPKRPSLPQVAAVCVYPSFVATARAALLGSTIRVASVATAFPSGHAPLEMKVEETRRAVGEGADEIDMVIARGEFLRGNLSLVADEILAIKDACGDAHLKVILETGELGSLEAVRRASDLALSCGADFIKTSTGKIQPAATLPITMVMCQAVRDHFLHTGRRAGVKPAGGIASAKLALQYLVLVHEILGSEWLTPELFRFGASRLVNDILLQLATQERGGYHSSDYFSKE